MTKTFVCHDALQQCVNQVYCRRFELI